MRNHFDPANESFDASPGIVRHEAFSAPVDTSEIKQPLIGIERFGLSFEESRKRENRSTFIWATIGMSLVGSGIMLALVEICNKVTGH
jgi:hypothetical protein